MKKKKKKIVVPGNKPVTGSCPYLTTSLSMVVVSEDQTGGSLPAGPTLNFLSSSRPTIRSFLLPRPLQKSYLRHSLSPFRVLQLLLRSASISKTAQSH